MKIIFDLIKDHKFFVASLLLISIAAAFFEALGIAIILPFLGVLLENSIGEEQLGELSNLTNYINIIWVGENKVLFFIIVILSLFISKNLLIYLRSILTTYFQNDIRKHFSVNILDKYHNSSIASLSRDNPGKLLNNLIQEPTIAGKFFAKLTDLIAQSLVVIMIFSVLLISNASLTIILTLAIIVLLILFRFFFKGVIDYIGKKRLKLAQDITNQGEQSIRALRDIKLLELTYKTKNSFIEKYNNNRSVLFRLSRIQNLPLPFAEIIIVTGIVTFIFYIEIIKSQSIIDFIPILGFIVVAAQRLASNLSQILSSRVFLQAYIPSLMLIHEIMFNNKYQENKKEFSKIKNIPIKKINKISVNELSHSYDNKNNILQDLSLDINRGNIIGIVGKSGSGKSTLVDIICGFYAQNEGLILNDDVDIRRYKLEEWRKHISLVSNYSFFFPGSIKSNLLLANENCTDEEIYRAISISQSQEFIDNLDKGIETKIDLGDNKLSTGQYQRLAIARALIKNANLIILDEATNHMDAETEKKFMNELSSIKHDKLILIITHNLRNLDFTDYIYVIDEGKIIEKGSLDQLAKSGDKFKEIFQ